MWLVVSSLAAPLLYTMEHFALHVYLSPEDKKSPSLKGQQSKPETTPIFLSCGR
jgi:hypothetical protein